MVEKIQPLFDEYGMLAGTLVSTEKNGKKRIYFRSPDNAIIEMPNIQKFLDFLRNRDIPEEEIQKGLKFFKENILAF